ncbi:unnamed protein product [Rotaria magnacalcarata]
MCFKYISPNTSHRLPKPPGTVASYSNEGSALAALVVERVSNMSYIAYVKQMILKPLGIDINKVGVRLSDFKDTVDLVTHYAYASNESYLKRWNQQIPQLNIEQMPDGRRYIDHSGSMPGMIHLMLVNEKHNLGVIILSNADATLPNDLSREIGETGINIHMSLFKCFDADPAHGPA